MKQRKRPVSPTDSDLRGYRSPQLLAPLIVPLSAIRSVAQTSVFNAISPPSLEVPGKIGFLLPAGSLGPGDWPFDLGGRSRPGDVRDWGLPQFEQSALRDPVESETLFLARWEVIISAADLPQRPGQTSMIRFAWRNLINRPVRTVLSVLGLSVAIAGMVGLFAISGGIQHLVTRTFEKVPGLLVQQRGAPIPIFSSLPVAWEQEIAALPGVDVVNSEVMLRVNLIEEKRILSPPRFLLGIDIPSRLQLKHGVYDEHLVEGRFLGIEDRGTLNCVLSRQIAKGFGCTVGSTLAVNGTTFRIVGLYDCKSQLLDVNILVDIETLRRLGRISPDIVSCYYVEKKPEFTNREVKTRIEQHFQGREWKPSGVMETINLLSGEGPNPFQALATAFDAWAKGGGAPASSSSPTVVPTGEPNTLEEIAIPSSVEVLSPEDWAEQFNEFSGDLKLFLTLISAVGFLIAVLSILNTMLMSVVERVGEFGILRANGWTRGEVLRLVISESAVIGLSGGIVGVLLGTLASIIANQLWPDKLSLHVSIGLAMFGFLTSTLLGVLGGLYPAWKAASLSPMDAIRRA